MIPWTMAYCKHRVPCVYFFWVIQAFYTKRIFKYKNSWTKSTIFLKDIDMTENRNNYFRLVALIVDVAYLVISKYIKEKILGPDSFESFLNKEKHKLVHIYETFPCCKCSIQTINRERLISKEQLHILYHSDERNLIRDHKKYAGNKLTQICICKYSARAHIDVRVVDITLANYIIQKCGKHELGIDSWMKQIKDVRNEIFHLSDFQEIKDVKFSRKWTTLEGSLLGIANVIGTDCVVETKNNIMQAKQLTLIGDYMLKYEIICRDYWKNKCTEFERAQNQVIEEKAAALHHTMPQQFSRSMEKDCQQTMRKIQTLDSMVDKINVMVNIFGSEENAEIFDDTELVTQDNKRILIPVFMQLDIPTAWDKTKVFEAIDEFRFKGTTDMNIRIKAISIDDLNMYAEIAKQVLGDVHKLRYEINKIMSTMLSVAKIDTMEHADVGVNLEVLDRSETTPTTEEVIVQTSLKNNLPVSANLRTKLKIRKHFWNKNPGIYSCIKTGNTLVFTDYRDNRLFICNADGTDMHHIPLSYKPRYITVIDSNTVAVACAFDSTILIINISTRTVTSTINTSGPCWGISYNDNNLYVVIDGSIIHVMDLTGKVIRTIPVPTVFIRDITVDRDRLVCKDQTSIYCCSLEGKVMWKFKKIPDLGRVTTDDEGNVYVTSEETHTVVVVSEDGKRHRELITESDGLNKPWGIYYDKKENSLLVCNDWDAYLFDVKQQ